jgi:heat-inducible transcriptional repressor
VKKIYLRGKDRNILNLIVESYLKKGKAISSGFIAEADQVSSSPATVRNVMSRLEKLGFLLQPHTSAGRVPTDRGLRFYVNSLFEEALVPEEQVSLASADFSKENGDFDSLLSQASKILAEFSNNLGFVLSPRISRINFQHIRLIKIGEQKVMIILITTSNLVITEITETNTYFTQGELDRASEYINTHFRGKNLFFVRDYLLNELPHYRLKYESIIHKLFNLLKLYIYQEESESRIFLQGASKLLEKPEFFDMKKLRSLFQRFEEKAKLAKLLSDFISLDKVKVLIGSELKAADISDCSLILSHYGYDSQVLGSLGIIGPKRIPYKKIIPLVDSVARKLSKSISFTQ